MAHTTRGGRSGRRGVQRRLEMVKSRRSWGRERSTAAVSTPKAPVPMNQSIWSPIRDQIFICVGFAPSAFCARLVSQTVHVARGLQWLSTGRHSSTVLSPRYRFDLASILFIYPGRHRKRVAHSSGGRSARETTRLFPERHPRHPHTCRRTVGHHSDSTRSHADTRTLATKLLLLTLCANDDPL